MKNLALCLLFCTTVFAQSEGTIESVGTKLFYRTFGNGKPLLIINGGPGMNSDGFISLAEKLAVDNMTIAYDQRGTGKSTVENLNSSTITMDLMVLDIENLRQHLGIKKWVVLGHSFGGMLASYYATIHPTRIEKLILSSSGGIDLDLLSYVETRTNEKLSTVERDSLDYYNQKLKSGDTSYAVRIGRGRALAPAYVYRKKNIQIIAERLTQENSTLNSLVWQNLSEIKFNVAEKVKDFEQKVLIIQGKNDIVDMATAEKIQKAFKNSSLVRLDKCGHYGWLDRPEQYFVEISKFLNSI